MSKMALQSKIDQAIPDLEPFKGPMQYPFILDLAKFSSLSSRRLCNNYTLLNGLFKTLKRSKSGMACSILDLKAIFDIYVSRALISLLCILELSGLVREIFFLTSFPGFLERRAINKNL